MDTLRYHLIFNILKLILYYAEALTMAAASFLAFPPKRYSEQRVKTPKTLFYLQNSSRKELI